MTGNVVGFSMKYLLLLSIAAYAYFLSSCSTTTASGKDSFLTTRNFSSFIDGTAEVGNIYAITGESLGDGGYEIALGEMISRVHTIPGNENRVLLLNCEYPISNIMNEKNRLHDVLFVYKGRGSMDRSASGSSLRPTIRRRIIAAGEIIGTKDWHHPKFEKEWNEWAKVSQ